MLLSSKDSPNILNEVPNFEKVITTIKEKRENSDIENVSYKNISNLEKNKILIKIYNGLIWNNELSLPKFSDFNDFLITIEYLFTKPFFEKNIYINEDNENIMDFNLISRIKKVYKLLSETVLNFYLDKNENNEKNNKTNIDPKQEEQAENDINNNKKLCDIIETYTDFFKNFCITIYSSYQNKFCKLIQKLEFLFSNIFISNISFVKIFINTIINPLIAKYEYCKYLHHEYKYKNYIEKIEHKEDIRMNKRILDSIEKKFICIYDLFKSSEDDNIKKLNEYIRKEFIDKYVTIYKDNEIEDIEFTESDDNEKEKNNKNKKKSKGDNNKNKNDENKNIEKEKDNLDNSYEELEDEVTYSVLDKTINHSKNNKNIYKDIYNNNMNNKENNKKNIKENNKEKFKEKNKENNKDYNKVKIKEKNKENDKDSDSEEQSKKGEIEKKYYLRNKNKNNPTEEEKELEIIKEIDNPKRKKVGVNKDKKNNDNKEIKDDKNNIKTKKKLSPKKTENAKDFDDSKVEIRIGQKEEEIYFNKNKKKEIKDTKKSKNIKKDTENPKLVSNINNDKNKEINLEEKENIELDNTNSNNKNNKRNYILGNKFNLDDIDLNNMKKINGINKKQKKLNNVKEIENINNKTRSHKNIMKGEFLSKKRQMSSNSSNIRDQLKKLDLRNFM